MLFGSYARTRTRVASYLAACAFVYLFLPVQNTVAATELQNIKQDEIQFKNGDVTLAGTLLLPLTKGTHPAIVILHGSGPDEGSEYRLYAEQFARAVSRRWSTISVVPENQPAPGAPELFMNWRMTP